MRAALEMSNFWCTGRPILVEIIGSMGFVYDGMKLHVRLVCPSSQSNESCSYADYLVKKRVTNQRRRDLEKSARTI